MVHLNEDEFLEEVWHRELHMNKLNMSQSTVH